MAAIGHRLRFDSLISVSTAPSSGSTLKALPSSSQKFSVSGKVELHVEQRFILVAQKTPPASLVC